MTALVQYDAACAALAAAVTADEVMRVHLDAKAIEAVARVAKNFDLEVDAVKLRTRAEARLGEMLEQGEAQGIIAGHGGRRPPAGQDSVAESCAAPATLKEIGVDGKLSSRARKLGGIGQQAVQAMLDRFERESRSRGRVAMDVILGETARRNADSRRHLAQDLSDAAALQPSGRRFPVLYADPAWRRKAGIGNRAYENHYVTMSWEELIAMPVANRLLPDAWGFVWIPRAHLLALVEVEAETSLGRARVKMPLAWALAKAWGFDAYSTCFVWTKTDAAAPDDHGLGLIAWDQDELLLLFKRGNGLPKPDTDRKFGSNHRERAGAHSAKPAFYRDMINAMTGGVPVLELFAREDDDNPLPPNFFTWGNQSRNSAEAPVDAAGAPLAHDSAGEIIDNPTCADLAQVAPIDAAARAAASQTQAETEDCGARPGAPASSEPAPVAPCAAGAGSNPEMAAVEAALRAHGAPVDDLDPPDFLRRGHPDCKLGRAP